MVFGLSFLSRTKSFGGSSHTLLKAKYCHQKLLIAKQKKRGGVVQKVLKLILTPQHKVLILVKDTICCGVKNPKQAIWTAPCNRKPNDFVFSELKPI